MSAQAQKQRRPTAEEEIADALRRQRQRGDRALPNAASRLPKVQPLDPHAQESRCSRKDIAESLENVARRLRFGRFTEDIVEGTPSPLEDYFTVKEVGKALRLSASTVNYYFQDVAGVLKIAPRGNRERKRITLRIPRSAFERFVRERSR